jgi:hypothetical protein
MAVLLDTLIFTMDVGHEKSTLTAQGTLPNGKKWSRYQVIYNGADFYRWRVMRWKATMLKKFTKECSQYRRAIEVKLEFETAPLKIESGCTDILVPDAIYAPGSWHEGAVN